MKTLGICIPTYKRPDFLRRCVLSAIESAQHNPVQIFVADDSASDVNDAVLAELTAAWPCVHAHKNAVNLGLDNNIQRSVELCGCDYAWLVGEDDTFLPGAVARMFDLVQHVDAPFICANYSLVGEDPTVRLASAIAEVSTGPMQTRHFISNYLWAAGFLGGCIVRRVDWDRTDPAPYSGTYYTHVGRIVEMIADERDVMIVSDPCVANRVEGDNTFTWKHDSYGVFFGFVSMCIIAGRRLPELAVAMDSAWQKMAQRYRWLSLRNAVRLRSELGFDIAQYQKYLRGSSRVGRTKKFALMLISITPPAIFRTLVRAYRSRRKLA